MGVIFAALAQGYSSMPSKAIQDKVFKMTFFSHHINYTTLKSCLKYELLWIIM